jgi:hypothetical protein
VKGSRTWGAVRLSRRPATKSRLRSTRPMTFQMVSALRRRSGASGSSQTASASRPVTSAPSPA